MSCYYLSQQLNKIVKLFAWFNNTSRNKLIFLSITLMVFLDLFFSNSIKVYGLKVIFIIIIFSFGRDDFIKLLKDNRQSTIQSSLYCISMLLTILIGVLFVLLV